MRGSFATWLKLKRADVKDAQALMRRSKASTRETFINSSFLSHSNTRIPRPYVGWM